MLPSTGAFDVEAVAAGDDQFFSPKSRVSGLRRRLPRLTSDLSYQAVVDRLRECSGAGLVVGAGERSSIFGRAPNVEWTVSDVDLRHGTSLVADVCSLPVEDEAFDVVIAENVLEHVVDPVGAAAQLQRVCRTGGTVIASVPFLHPWHGEPYDFFRVTPTGLRSLFRHCATDHLLVGMGTGSNLALSINDLSLFSSHVWVRRVGTAVARVGFGWLRRLDSAAQLHSAGSLTFIGTKDALDRSDRMVLDDVRGLSKRR